MVSLAFIRRFLFNVKFWDIFVAFLLATLPFIFRCSRRPHFVRWAIAWLVPIRLLCLFFAHTYGGNIAVEAFYSAILILLMIGGLLCCFEEKLSNVLFYFSSGFATWYISDRLFLVIASICRCNLVRRTEKGRLRRRGWGLRWEKAQKGGKGTNLRGFFED